MKRVSKNRRLIRSELGARSYTRFDWRERTTQTFIVLDFYWAVFVVLRSIIFILTNWCYSSYIVRLHFMLLSFAIDLF